MKSILRKMVLSLFQFSLKVNGKISPSSKVGHSTLCYLFEVQSVVERAVNGVCNEYYAGKHPKHFMWLAHNKYLFDSINPEDRVLDIGCGASFYPQWLAEKASEVVCVDVLPDRVEQASRNNRNSKVSYELMDVTVALPQGRFDVAVCSHVLEHLDDPGRMLRRLSERVPRIIVKVPLEDSGWMKLVKRDLGLFWMDDRDHRREYSEDMLREQLESSGWLITEMIRGADLRATASSVFFNPESPPLP